MVEKTYKTRECDYDTKKAEELYGDKSAEELEQMWQELKEKIVNEIEKSRKIYGE